MQAIAKAASSRLSARSAGSHGKLGAKRPKTLVTDYTKRQGNPEAGSRGPAFPGKDYGKGGTIGFTGRAMQAGSRGFIGRVTNGGSKASAGPFNG